MKTLGQLWLAFIALVLFVWCLYVAGALRAEADFGVYVSLLVTLIGIGVLAIPGLLLILLSKK